VFWRSAKLKRLESKRLCGEDVEIFRQDAGDDPWLARRARAGSDDVLRAEAGLPERPA